jgi:hypothetical protein
MGLLVVYFGEVPIYAVDNFYIKATRQQDER